MPNIHERIKERRLSQGYTLAQLGDMLGVKEATVQRYESGEIKNIKHETISQLAFILKCTPEYLMGWSDTAVQTTPDAVLSERSLEFVELFSKLSEEQQRLVISQIKGILSNQ